MTHGFQIDEALSDGFRLIRRRPGDVLAWGVILALPVMLSVIVMIDLFMTIGPEAMAEDADPSPQALAAMMRMQAWSMLINVVQLIGYVLIIAAICRAVLWPERAPGRFFDLRVGMDEAKGGRGRPGRHGGLLWRDAGRCSAGFRLWGGLLDGV